MRGAAIGGNREPWGVPWAGSLGGAGGSRGTVWNRRARGPEASREGRSSQSRERRGSRGKLSQRERSRDNPAGRPTGGMTATRPPRHMTIPHPRGVTWQSRHLGTPPGYWQRPKELQNSPNARRDCRVASGHWQPAERPYRRGCRTAARRRQLVECSNTDPKDQEDLQEERIEELQGPQGSRQEVVYIFKPLSSDP